MIKYLLAMNIMIRFVIFKLFTNYVIHLKRGEEGRSRYNRSLGGSEQDQKKDKAFWESSLISDILLTSLGGFSFRVEP